jgi:starvation-inducible DNA-binding protein
METLMAHSRAAGSAALHTPTDLGTDATQAITAALNPLVADAFALYVKTKNFHWHVSGPHFRDYHLLLDDQGDQIFAMTDELAERVRKVGGNTLRSIGHITKLKRVADNDAEFVSAHDMLGELMEDNKAFAAHMREAHEVAGHHGDVATTSILETFIDETEKRVWFLFETTRRTNQPND